MTTISTEVDPTSDFFKHYGVKGMKWGVRRQKRLDRASAVAKGTSSKTETLRFHLTEVSSNASRKHGGTQGVAKHLVKDLETRKKRIQAGEATAKDVIALYGGDRITLSSKSSSGKTSSPPAKSSGGKTSSPQKVKAKNDPKRNGQDGRTKAGKVLNQHLSEQARVKAHGGGLKGTMRLRREMLETGELSRADHRKGNIKMGAGVATYIAGLGVGAAYIVKKSS